MTPERWCQIEKFYPAAIEIEGDERAALLAQADADVRHEVQAMLAQPTRSNLPGNPD